MDIFDSCRVCKSNNIIMELSDDCTPGNRCKDCGAFTVPEYRRRVGNSGKVGMTEAEIEAGRSPKGGFSRLQLEQWGVPWPPPKGWKKALLNGDDPALLNGKKTADQLLREVVLAIVEQGQGHLIEHLDDVHEYFGARIPTQEEILASKKTLRNDSGENVPWV